jgi:hypothetical protein
MMTLTANTLDIEPDADAVVGWDLLHDVPAVAYQCGGCNGTGVVTTGSGRSKTETSCKRCGGTGEL